MTNPGPPDDDGWRAEHPETGQPPGPPPAPPTPAVPPTAPAPPDPSSPPRPASPAAVPPTAVPPTVVPLPEPTAVTSASPGNAAAQDFPTAEITPASGGGGHRAASRLGPLGRGIAAPLAAVVVVVVVIVLLIWINGKPSGKQTGPGVVAAPTPSTPVATAPVVPTQAPSSATAQPTSHATPTKPKATKSVQSGTAGPAGATAMAPVVVLNNSTITGLAAQVASELRARGWHVNAVGNQQAVIPETTLYYGSGERAAALHLAKQFSQIQRVRSAAAAGISSYGGNLTLVVTRDWT